MFKRCANREVNPKNMQDRKTEKDLLLLLLGARKHLVGFVHGLELCLRGGLLFVCLVRLFVCKKKVQQLVKQFILVC